MARRNTSPGHRRPPNFSVASSSLMVTKLPSDLLHLLAFDLQEAVVHPDVRHRRRAVARSAIARFRSHGGEKRGRCRRRGCRTDAAAQAPASDNKPLRRGSSQSHRSAIAEHSMTQTRPALRDDAFRRRPCRFAGLRGFPQHEIHRPFFIGRDLDAGLRPPCPPATDWTTGRSQAWMRHRRARGPRRHRRGPRSISASQELHHSWMCSVARGSCVGSSTPSGAMSFLELRFRLFRQLANAELGREIWIALPARALILSSTSVMLRT